MTGRAELSRELVELEEETERLTAAITEATARAEERRAAPAPSEPAFTELGAMVLDVQRQLDELEATHAIHRQHIEAAADTEAERIVAHGQAQARSIRAALQTVTATEGRPVEGRVW